MSEYQARDDGVSAGEGRSAATASRWPIGREDSPATDWNQMSEEQRWIGKPWRRIELLTHRFFWKGEEFDRDRTLSFHVGFRRLGLGFTFSVVKASVLEYSEEPQ